MPSEPFESGPLIDPPASPLLTGDTAVSLETTQPTTPGTSAFELSDGAILDGKYELVSRLGAGGMSVVFKARHTKMDKIFAVKMLHSHLIKDRSVLDRFVREARAEYAVKHRNVLAVHSMGVSESGQLYLVMDYIEGISLDQVLEQQGTLPHEVARRIFIKICNGLSAAHDKRIIHRDMKPSNVMLVGPIEHCEVKVVDFGIAKIVDTADVVSQKITKTGMILGSPSYMSPEQCRGEILDIRSDIYSLGCLMYEVLTGHLPFEAGTSLETMARRLTDDAPPFSTWPSPSVVAPELEALVLKTLNADPTQRSQSADELAEELNVLDLTSQAVRRPRSKFRQLPFKQRKQIKMAAVSLGAFLLAGSIVLAINQNLVPLSINLALVRAGAASVLPFDKQWHVSEVIEAAGFLFTNGEQKEARKLYSGVLSDPSNVLFLDDSSLSDAILRTWTDPVELSKEMVALTAKLKDKNEPKQAQRVLLVVLSTLNQVKLSKDYKPHVAVMLELCGELSASLRQYRDAISCFEKALSVLPEDPVTTAATKFRLLRKLGGVYYQDGNSVGLENVVAQSISLASLLNHAEKDEVAGLIQLFAQYHRDTGDSERMRTELQRAIDFQGARTSKLSLVMRQQIADSLVVDRKYGRALEQYQLLLSVSAKHPELGAIPVDMIQGNIITCKNGIRRSHSAAPASRRKSL